MSIQKATLLNAGVRRGQLLCDPQLKEKKRLKIIFTMFHTAACQIHVIYPGRGKSLLRIPTKVRSKYCIQSAIYKYTHARTYTFIHIYFVQKITTLFNKLTETKIRYAVLSQGNNNCLKVKNRI